MKQPGVQMLDLAHVEVGRCATEMSEVEALRQTIEVSCGLDRLTGAEPGEQAEQRHRL